MYILGWGLPTCQGWVSTVRTGRDFFTLGASVEVADCDRGGAVSSSIASPVRVGSKARRLESLTGLRFFAAFTVFGIHSLYYGDGAWGEGLFAAGMTGVSFFYVVSGFVLAWTARADDTPVQFYRRRFARIYPAYVAAWLVSLVVLFISGRGIGLVDFAPLTLLQAWVPDPAVYFAANAVFWSLSCEAFFYLVFPVLYKILIRLTAKGLAITMGGTLAAVGAATVTIAQLTETVAGVQLFYIFPPARLPEFALGMMLALLLQRGVKFGVPLWLATTISVAAYFTANFSPEPYERVAVTLVPFMLLIWAAATADLAGARSIFRWKPLVTLGIWSYAFYLIHTQAMTAFFEVLDHLGVNTASMTGVFLVVAVAGSFVCATVASALLHRFVEAPFEKRLRGSKVAAKSVGLSSVRS